MNAPYRLVAGILRPSHLNGATHPTCTTNLNKIRPPKYFKVLNNKSENGEAACRYIINDTSGEGISDGGWYRDADTPDTMGGFFGNTKFHYGEGDGEFFIGTENKASVSDSFIFTKEPYKS